MNATHTQDTTMTREEATKVAISRAILIEMTNGKTIKEAYDTVLGEGAYAKLASDMWESLRNVK
jgi:hypothetical protein